MSDINNTFLAGRMDKDLDERIIGDGIYRDALNIRVDTADGASVGSAKNSLGNTRIGNILSVLSFGVSVVNAKTIGAVKYERDNLIYWIVASDEFDAIFEYNEKTNVIVKVLQCNKVNGNPSKLNLDQDYIITGINYINGFLYWTDDLNPPRAINIARCKSYYTDDVRIDDDINVILRPPLYSPLISPFNDGTDSNNLSEKFLSFSYRYKYVDGQFSAMSPFSAIPFSPDGTLFDYTEGNNGSMKNSYNAVSIIFNTGNENVTDVQIIMKDVYNINLSIIETFNKRDLGYGDFASRTFLFKNNKTYSVLGDNQLTRLFDNVPIRAKAQEFVGDRLMYGNYTQFYDIKDKDGNPIVIDLKASYLSESVDGVTAKKSFKSDRDYQLGIVYLDDYGRSSTVLTSQNNSVHIPAYKSITANSLLLKIKNPPPYWATHYRIAIKQNTREYYNLFPILFYEDGSYRYFLINESDRDKISVGKYIIFKATSNGPTLSNQKYKILEIEAKPANFISGTASQVPGIYFKIKVDDSTSGALNTSYHYQSSNTGTGAFQNTSLVPIAGTIIPQDPFTPLSQAGVISQSYNRIVETPIYYGKSNKNALSVNYNSFTGYELVRFIVKVTAPNVFEYYANSTHNGGVYASPILMSQNISIIIGQEYTINYSSGQIKFTFPSNPVVGDKWAINCKYIDAIQSPLTGVYRFSMFSRLEQGYSGYLITANAAIVPSQDDEIVIKKGAVITLKITSDNFNPSTQVGLQQFTPSDKDYENIQEWWYESGACRRFSYLDKTGSDVGAKYVCFLRGSSVRNVSGTNTTIDNNTMYFPISDEYNNGYNGSISGMKMIIYSSIQTNDRSALFGNSKDQPYITVEFTIDQQDQASLCETVAKPNDVDLYHELSSTFPIIDDLHYTGWRYNDFVFYNGRTQLTSHDYGYLGTKNDVHHRFVKGDAIFIWSSDISAFPSGSYTVYEVLDQWNIVLDFTFPGAGPVTYGYAWGSANYDFDDQMNYTTRPAIVKINSPGTPNSDFNSWSYGTGLETDRILDDFNQSTLQYSPRVNSTTNEYKQITSENAICYSGIYGINTSTNKLNEFNLSIANFKYLDKSFGSIQKLHPRDTDLLVFQEEKISFVLYEKNLLSDSSGGGSIVSIPEVLGTQITFHQDYGISRNPESFAKWGDDIFFTDSRRGSVLNLVGNNLSIISDNGMKSHFRDLMRDNYNKQKLGGYDVHNKMYVLSSNNIFNIPCKLSIDRSFVSATFEAQTLTLFQIETTEAWTIQAQEISPYGTDWAGTLSFSGIGGKKIRTTIAENNLGFKRSINYIITYCGGKTITFTLYQGSSKTRQIVPYVIAGSDRGFPSSPSSIERLSIRNNNDFRAI